jgi:hypothetical protein
MPPDRRWGFVRLALGGLQMTGATAAMLLLVREGVTPLSLGIVVVTGLCTTVSVVLFGSDRPRWHRNRKPRR